MNQQLRKLSGRLLRAAPVRKLFSSLPLFRARYSRWARMHPFDAVHGTDTDGFVPVEKLHHDQALWSQINPYAASQPGIIRKAILALGPIDGYRFYDLGAGKGRVLFVAAEFPFAAVTGVELSHALVRIARQNATILARKSPQPSPVTLVEANAASYLFEAGRAVVFIYHAFGRELLSQVIHNLEAGLRAQIQHLFVIYYNPVHGDLFDASPAFQRWFADSVPYDDTELGYGVDTADVVVIWQSRTNARTSPHSRPDRRISARDAYRSELAP